jgi:hypothetical protein
MGASQSEVPFMFCGASAVKGDPNRRYAGQQSGDVVGERTFPNAQDSLPRPMNPIPFFAVTGNRLRAWLKTVDFGRGIRPLHELLRNFPVKFPC